MYYPPKRANHIVYIPIFSIILQKPRQDEPRLPIKVQSSPIMTLIVLNKRCYSQTAKGWHMNKPIPIKGEMEPNECLAQVCWLNTLYVDASFIRQVI